MSGGPGLWWEMGEIASKSSMLGTETAEAETETWVACQEEGELCELQECVYCHF